MSGRISADINMSAFVGTGVSMAVDMSPAVSVGTHVVSILYAFEWL